MQVIYGALIYSVHGCLFNVWRIKTYLQKCEDTTRYIFIKHK
jgi:hypothetical protein